MTKSRLWRVDAQHIPRQDKALRLRGVHCGRLNGAEAAPQEAQMIRMATKVAIFILSIFFVYLNMITEENKQEWIGWLDGQLDTTKNAEYTKTGKNRVFLTDQDDIDIAKHILTNFKELLETHKLVKK